MNTFLWGLIAEDSLHIVQLTRELLEECTKCHQKLISTFFFLTAISLIRNLSTEVT